MRKTWLWLLAALVCLGLTGPLHRSLLVRREAFRPPHQTDLRAAPPMVVFTTVALGGFRGILADLLWLRVASLQDEGRYFEITQLSDWITKLEPTFAEVWGYHAWNMAYNISVLFESPSDRWRWVEHGVRLLREDGIRYNPGDPRLYWELGWLFHHKIAGFSDSASGYYRERLFEAVTRILPNGRLNGQPAQSADAWRNAFRMDAGVMAALDEAVGPLDWRLPESHALYWAWMGRANCGSIPDLMLERLFYQSMMMAAVRGKHAQTADGQVHLRLIRTDLFAKTRAVLKEARRRFPDDDGIRAATDFFMRQAVVLLYAESDDTQAAAFLDEYRRAGADVPADLAAFVRQQTDSGFVADPGFVEQLAGFYFEAAEARRRGASHQAERLEATADSLYAGIARRLADEGVAMPVSLDDIREQGRRHAGVSGDGLGTAP